METTQNEEKIREDYKNIMDNYVDTSKNILLNQKWEMKNGMYEQYSSYTDKSLCISVNKVTHS